MFISVFFYGAKPQTEAQRSEDGVARLHLTAVRLRGAIWRLTRLRRSTAEPKCRMSEYDGSNLSPNRSLKKTGHRPVFKESKNQ